MSEKKYEIIDGKKYMIIDTTSDTMELSQNIIKKYEKKEKKENNIIDPIDLISVDEINKRMINFKRVLHEDIEKLETGVRIQYFEVCPEENKYKYKPGAILVYVKYPDYIILSNGVTKWSVQLKNNILFEENIDLLKRNFSKIIKEKDKTINELRNSLQFRIDELKELKKK